MTCPHGTNDAVGCLLCQSARVAEHMRDEQRRRARQALIVIAGLMFDPPPRPSTDPDPLAGPFGDELADMIAGSSPEIVARLREQLRHDPGALRVIDAALARKRGAP